MSYGSRGTRTSGNAKGEYAPSNTVHHQYDPKARYGGEV